MKDKLDEVRNFFNGQLLKLFAEVSRCQIERVRRMMNCIEKFILMICSFAVFWLSCSDLLCCCKSHVEGCSDVVLQVGLGWNLGSI